MEEIKGTITIEQAINGSINAEATINGRIDIAGINRGGVGGGLKKVDMNFRVVNIQ